MHILIVSEWMNLMGKFEVLDLKRVTCSMRLSDNIFSIV